MWTTDSGRWIFLLTLAAVMIVSTSQAIRLIDPNCCRGLSTVTRPYNKCYHLEKNGPCKVDAYMVKSTMTGNWSCIKPKNFVRDKKIQCHSRISRTRRARR
ncbi:unnamed protein product [Pleuronectes platessa]|uniref:Uncharacterized protein n=1 Tax=Pleuronectes platessa TaxID=8262 RepID=A0A9N7UP59_PLEPL|nr:unnamed protein product [Pleuronectes platessa]